MPGYGSYAALYGAESYQQGYEPLAKPDTLYLGRDDGAGIPDLATDLSQYADNQSRGATWHWEASPATRFNLTTRWCIEVEFTCDNADTGRFFTQGGTGRWRISIAAGGIVTITIQAGAALLTIGTLTLPGISGSDQRFTLQWSAEPNELTTGASNALRSELCAWNETTPNFDKAVFAHAARDSETGAAVFWAGSTAGANPFTGTPHACRFGSRFHSATETAIDFVDTRSEPATDVDTSSEHEGLPCSTSTGIHGRDSFHGPAAVWAVDKTRRLVRRLLTPLYNRRFRNTPTWTDALLTSGTNPKIRGAPGATDYRMHLGWLQVAPVPDTCSHLWVRVHVYANATSGAAVPCGIRFYTMNKPPGGVAAEVADEAPAETFVPYYVDELVTRDDGAAVGEWAIEALVPISRGTAGIRKGKTYLCIALAVDPESGSANDANAQLIVKACHAVPNFVATQGGLPVAEAG